MITQRLSALLLSSFLVVFASGANASVIYTLTAECIPESDCNNGASSGIVTGQLVLEDSFNGIETTDVDDFVSFSIMSDTRADEILRAAVPDDAFFNFRFSSPSEYLFILGFGRTVTDFRDGIGDFEGAGDSFDVFNATFTPRQVSVPEPGTLLITAASFIVLRLRLRRRLAPPNGA